MLTYLLQRVAMLEDVLEVHKHFRPDQPVPGNELSDLAYLRRKVALLAKKHPLYNPQKDDFGAEAMVRKDLPDESEDVIFETTENVVRWIKEYGV